MKKIGFIGLGIMGIRMSKRLVDSGYRVSAFDIAKASIETAASNGCSIAESSEQVVDLSDVIISMLPKPDITRDVLIGEKGILKSIEPGKVIIDMSTSSPTLAREMAEQFKEKKVEILDAPVSGGKAGAENGTLAIMVGGNRDAFEKVRPILEQMGKNIFYIGKAGSGHTTKLVNNMLFSVILAATSEAMVFGTKAGLEPEKLREVMLAGSGASYALKSKIRDFVFPRNFKPGFSVALQTKDIDLALQLGKDTDTPLVMANLVRQFYQTVINSGNLERDNSIIYELFEKMMK